LSCEVVELFFNNEEFFEFERISSILLALSVQKNLKIFVANRPPFDKFAHS
jgi:hypothetical protein